MICVKRVMVVMVVKFDRCPALESMKMLSWK